MTRLGTLRVTAPPPSPPHNSPPSTSTPRSQRQPATLRQPPLSKNLRWTAVALVSKLSKELERPSSAIADEVALAASHDMRTRFPEKDVAPVERNTRRRVYDALKVMVAVGCIQRHAKHLRWIGVDHLRYHKPTNGPNIRVSLCESRRRIGRKKALLTEIHRTINAFEALYTRRHRQHQSPDHHPTPINSPRIHFPMILVDAQHPQVAYSSDRHHVRLTTQAPFKVYSETDIVTMLAERTALKRPKVPKKRRHARSTSGTSHSPEPHPPCSSHPRHDPSQQSSPHLQLSDPACNSNDENTAQTDDAPKRDALDKKDTSRTKDNETSNYSIASTGSRIKHSVQDDSDQDTKMEPQKVTQVKAEPEEVSMADPVENTTELPEQILIYSTPATTEPSARQDGPDSESICPSASGTQGERDVSTEPLICDEELGIPTLADEDSSTPESDDDPMMGWKAGEESDNDFEQAFTAPIFHQV